MIANGIIGLKVGDVSRSINEIAQDTNGRVTLSTWLPDIVKYYDCYLEVAIDLILEDLLARPPNSASFRSQ
jgi:hypothetical protein